ncbi:Single-stranded DNA-binding protein [Candidatus Phytoplasma australiense]|uniref:Single-stranded DNA-binding protein n=2 Tax=Phytoplasma australiense TaxID=59748 RepID=B1V954_PHYAS|nr:single-stranded DNA-binding protein [Candidatus Phytoplasma australiense]AGL90806.1 Single-strand binding protein 1 [Strawberry lethal yellows phytoplasma (CPA) str. NZSb11]CAM11486.1 Single-stranded DNA-binding protein [Candidatus Phytoplasma australiense]
MINKVILVGRITKDPELKSYNGEVNYVKFTLAVNRFYNNQEENKKTDFINCIVWRKQAENLSKYIFKGNLLGVEGSIRVEKWEKDNKTNWSTEILCNNISFLESKKSLNATQEKDYQSNNDSSFENSQSNDFETNTPEDDGLPF